MNYQPPRMPYLLTSYNLSLDEIFQANWNAMSMLDGSIRGIAHMRVRELTLSPLFPLEFSREGEIIRETLHDAGLIT